MATPTLTQILSGKVVYLLYFCHHIALIRNYLSHFSTVTYFVPWTANFRNATFVLKRMINYMCFQDNDTKNVKKF